jgi:hypothetical protein
MFCGKCGAQVNDSERFCGSCGAEMNNQPQVQYSAQPTYGEEKPKKSKNKLIGFIACALVAVLVIVGAVAIFGRSEKPEIVVEKYLNASLEFDFKEIEKYSAINIEAALTAALASSYLSESEIAERLMDEYGTTNIRKIYEGSLKEQAQENMRDEFGIDYTLTVKVSGTSDLSESEMNRQIESLRDSFEDSNINPDDLIKLNKIKDMCRVRGNVTIEGSDDEDTQTFELLCVKMDGKWKVLGNPSSPLSSFDY